VETTVNALLHEITPEIHSGKNFSLCFSTTVLIVVPETQGLASIHLCDFAVFLATPEEGEGYFIFWIGNSVHD
jgi:hypothetical protein